MDTSAEIKKSLMSVLGITPNLPLTATVVSVEGKTCTIKLLDELELSDVRLTATNTESENGLIITPKVGSEVVVMSQTGSLSSLMVLKVNEVDTMTFKNEDLEFVIDGVSKKVTIKNEVLEFVVDGASKKVTIKNEDLEFVVDGASKKVTIKNGQANLGMLMATLIDAIGAAVLITPNGAGSIDPSTVTALNTVKSQFNLILNTN